MIVMKSNIMLCIEEYDTKEHRRIYYTYKGKDLIQLK